jgi:hypothetical protein
MNPVGEVPEAVDPENRNDGDAATAVGQVDDHDHDHGRSALAGVRADPADPRALVCSPLQVGAGSSPAKDHARECAVVVANDVVRVKELRAARTAPTGLEVAAMIEREAE